MANNQSYPQSVYPIKGDVDSEVGGNTVTVTGIQTVPVDPTTPQPQQLLVMGSDGVWHPEDPVVSGPDAVGSQSTRPPVQVAGVDSGGTVREVQTDTSGSLYLAGVEQRLDVLITEIRAMKTAIIALDNTLNAADFDAASYTDQTTSESVLP